MWFNASIIWSWNWRRAREIMFFDQSLPEFLYCRKLFFFVLSTPIICPGKEVPNINEEVEHRTYIGYYNHRSCSASVNLNLNDYLWSSPNCLLVVWWKLMETLSWNLSGVALNILDDNCCLRQLKRRSK